jgi:hypothetical protein
MCALMGGLFMAISTGVEGQTAITKIVNPQYHTMKMLAADVGKLSGK